MKKTTTTMLLGILLGTMLAAPAVSAASGVLAERSAQAVYVDGQRVELEAYLIDGSNYVKLRDIGQATNAINVYWDGNAVQIQSGVPYTGEVPEGMTVQQQLTAPATSAAPDAYTISVDHWSREDFSQQANPAVFTGVYSRALYNTIRQTMVDGTSENPAYTMVGPWEDYSAVKDLIGRMEGVLRYEHYVPKSFTNYYEYLDYFAVSAEIPENYQAPLDFIQPVINAAAGMTDREKVERFNDYIRTLLAYEEGQTSGITQAFAPHDGELKAACGSYARAMKFLCAAVDIPCFTISTKTHTWNLVYVDGRWLHVDVSFNDLSGRNDILLRETYGGEDQAPEATAFLKELYVPGSTK